MPVPRLYDIATDLWREVTHADVERLTRGEQAFGALVAYLRNTAGGGEPAQIAVEMAQGKITLDAGSRLLDALLQEKK